MKYYIVSDIHGYYNQLKQALKKAGFYNDKCKHKLIIVGDYFDRGEQARKIQSFISDLVDKDDVILIKGNHEDLMEDLIKDVNMYESNLDRLMQSHHFHNSTISTVCQLLKCKTTDIVKNPSKIAEKMQKTDYFTKILPNTMDYFETENFIMTHGYIPLYGLYNDEFDEDWRNASTIQWKQARWFNPMEKNHLGLKENKVIIAGHWHASFGHYNYEGRGSEFGEDAIFEPYYGNKLIAIDGCTARSGIVNCIIINDNPSKIMEASTALRKEQIVCLPTETVLGLAVRYDSKKAAKKLYKVKERPANKALPIAIGRYEMIKEVADVSEKQFRIIQRLLPGPITVVVKANPNNKYIQTKTVAIRFPEEKNIVEIINHLNKPIYLTSANLSGKEPFKTAKEAKKVFKDSVGYYMDGRLGEGQASTIIDLTSPEISVLREGPVSLQQIHKMIGDEL